MRKLLILVLIWGFVFRAGVLVWRNADYWYDEAVVTNISKQSTSMLLNTVSSEPHPPGFYFFLKLFPVDNPLATRLSLLVISEILLICGVAWAATNIKKWDELVPGLCVFLLSYGYLWSGMDVKQGVICVPLFLWWFWIWLKGWDAKLNKSEVGWIGVLSILLAGMEYRFAAAMAILCLVQIWMKRAKELMVPLVLVVATLSATTFVFGFDQILSNLTRFGWMAEKSSSLFSGVVAFFLGRPLSEWIGDMVLFLVLGWVIFLGRELYSEKGKNIQMRWKGIFLTGAGLFALAVATRSFVLVRYPMILYWVLCQAIGFGMYRSWLVGKAGKMVVAWSLGIFCLAGAFGVIAYNPGWFSRKLIASLKAINQKVGLVTEHPNYATVFLTRVTRPSNIVGINLYDVEGAMSQDVTKAVLDLEGMDIKRGEMSEKEIVDALKKTGLKSFAYLVNLNVRPIYDQNRRVFFVLGRSCSMVKTETFGGNTLFIFWDKCSFGLDSTDPIPVEKIGSQKG